MAVREGDLKHLLLQERKGKVGMKKKIRMKLKIQIL